MIRNGDWVKLETGEKGSVFWKKGSRIGVRLGADKWYHHASVVWTNMSKVTRIDNYWP